jgi:hypothetical protein
MLARKISVGMLMTPDGPKGRSITELRWGVFTLQRQYACKNETDATHVAKLHVRTVSAFAAVQRVVRRTAHSAASAFALKMAALPN